MTQSVSDIRANANETIVRAAQVIGRSKYRRIIFKAIYTGKQKVKTAEELSRLLSDIPDPQQRIIKALDMARDLSSEGIIHTKKDEKTKKMAYVKDSFYVKNRDKILSLVENPEKIKKIPTKSNPTNQNVVKISIGRKINCNFITIDEIDSFQAVKSVPPQDGVSIKIKEEVIKNLFKKIIGETGTFKDWGGEKNDLYSSKLKVRGKRLRASIAFKGKATTGKLTPEKMGTRGDQIERLFSSPADVFIVVYQGQIDQSIIAQMQAFATGKALSGQKVYYGVIDEDDLKRLLVAYSD